MPSRVISALTWFRPAVPSVNTARIAPMPMDIPSTVSSERTGAEKILRKLELPLVAPFHCFGASFNGAAGRQTAFLRVQDHPFAQQFFQGTCTICPA